MNFVLDRVVRLCIGIVVLMDRKWEKWFAVLLVLGCEIPARLMIDDSDEPPKGKISRLRVRRSSQRTLQTSIYLLPHHVIMTILFRHRQRAPQSPKFGSGYTSSHDRATTNRKCFGANSTPRRLTHPEHMYSRRRPNFAHTCHRPAIELHRTYLHLYQRHGRLRSGSQNLIRIRASQSRASFIRTRQNTKR